MRAFLSRWENLLALALLGGLGLGWAVRALRRSEDPARLASRWALSGALLAGIVLVGIPAALAMPLGGVPLLAAFGILLGVIWAPSFAEMLVRPLVNAWTGGMADGQAKPLYSVVEARLKAGRYLEAVAVLRSELARFPGDYEGLMMLAEIQAERLNDLDAAGQTIEELLQQPGRAPASVAAALTRLADWRIKGRRDLEGARLALERIVATFPATEEGYWARQRLAKLPSGEGPEPEGPRAPVALARGVENLGLQDEPPARSAPADDPDTRVARWVRRLEECPHDDEVRERLAAAYADDYRRLDLARQQLEQLIEQPGAPARLVIHWLNLLADLQIRGGAKEEEAWQSLERICARYPGTPAAELARKRQRQLPLEMRAQHSSGSVPLGQYEQHLGLKTGWPSGPGPACSPPRADNP